MVVTNNDELAQRARLFRGQGLAAQREYWHEVIGYNYRMTNICAAIGLAQLERASEFLSKKREVAKAYQKGLSNLPIELHGEAANTVHSHWMISLLVEDPPDRDRLRSHLRERGIETRPLFYPVHTMSMYANGQANFPVAENLARRGINLPSWPGLTAAQIETIVSGIADYFRTSRRDNRK
jgi:perosamine synthetase